MDEDILWLRFAEDTSLPTTLEKHQQNKLAEIFDPANPHSPWSLALERLGVKTAAPPAGLIQWFDHYPYMNWTYMSALLSGGTIQLVRAPDNTFSMSQTYGVFKFWRLLKIHWAISSYLAQIRNAPLPDEPNDQLVQSLALGLCLLGLQQRLNISDDDNLASALQHPERLPKRQQETIRHIAEIQKCRTALSPAWETLFPMKETSSPQKSNTNRPPYFWNSPENKPNPPKLIKTSSDCWKGTGICGAPVSGKLMIINSLNALPLLKKEERPLILVFQYARPDTIRLFSEADGVLYCNGGTLSHACTIAREQNIPCITALGEQFLEDIKALLKTIPDVHIEISPQTGSVRLAG